MIKRKLFALLLSLLLVVSLAAPFNLAFASDTDMGDKVPEPVSDLIPGDEDTLFDRLMACSSLEDGEATLDDASQDEIDALSDEQLDAIEQHFAAFIDSGNTPPETITFTEAFAEGLESGREVEPEDPEVLLTDTQKLRDSLMKLQSQAELESFIVGLSEAEQEALAESLTENDKQVLNKRFGWSFNVNAIDGVAYTNVGKLMPPVMLGSSKSQKFTTLNNNTGSNEGLEMSKVVTPNVDGSYTITLELFTTGEVVSTVTSIPTDIVLVLDESGSMSEILSSVEVYSADLDKSKTYYVETGWIITSYTAVKWCDQDDHNGWYSGNHGDWIGHTQYTPKTSSGSSGTQFYERTTRMEALQSAAKNFVKNAYDDAVANDVDHRIAVVSFAANSTIEIGLGNDIREQKNGVDNAINGLIASGGTYIEKGMADAIEVYKNAPVKNGLRQRVVVVFTDGIPGNGTWSTNTIDNSANPAIQASNTLKKSVGSEGYGATVYTIGMLSGANPSLPIDTGSSDNARTNRFLHYLSSNFPNATSMNNGGTGGGIGGGYYLAATSAEELEEIFQKISETISTPTIQLDSTTVIKDVVSPYFTIPENTSEISLFTAEYNGTTFNDRVSADGSFNVEIRADERSLSVDGFNFNENFVTDAPKEDGTYGSKLIVEFTISPRDGFLGGNDVPTNGESSGVYDKDGGLIGNFELPTVDVPLKPIIITIPSTVLGSYYGQPIDVGDLKLNAKVKIGSVELNFRETNFGLEPWQYEFVKINVSSSTDPVGGLDGATTDFTYTLSVAVTPSSAGTIPSQGATETGNGSILVFTPKLTFKDSEVWYGDTATYGTLINLVEPTWIHDFLDHKDESLVMLNTEPVLTLGYTPDSAKINASGVVETKLDIPVNVVVSIPFGTDGTITNITGITSFVHQACDPACGWTDPAEPGDPAFLLHVKTVTLTVTKIVGASAEPYVFTILKDGVAYTEATITGSGSVTIKELPVGAYSIEENVNWSWRFTPTYSPNSVTLDSTNIAGTIECHNQINGLTKWLNAYSEVIVNCLGVPKEGG